MSIDNATVPSHAEQAAKYRKQLRLPPKSTEQQGELPPEGPAEQRADQEFVDEVNKGRKQFSTLRSAPPKTLDDVKADMRKRRNAR